MALELTIRRISKGSISVSKQQFAGVITLLIYAIGISGLLFGDFNFFVRSTPFVLILNFLFVIWTEKNFNSKFFIFLFASFLISMLLEIIGIQTGNIFGNYVYSDLLGIKLMEVPLVIGLNWLVLIYGAGNLMSWVLKKFSLRHSMIVSVTGGALFTTLFDWIMEPAATRLGYWHWIKNDVPMSNYISWFLLSIVLIFLYEKYAKGSINYFAILLLSIQALFFITLRIFLQ